MVTRSTRRGLILFSVLCLGSYLLTREHRAPPPQPMEGLDIRLNYALQNFAMRAFDEAGQPLFHMQAPKLTNEAATSIGRVENPVLEVRHEGFIWHIIADGATVSDDRSQVFLAGNVSLRRSSESAESPLLIDSSDVNLAVGEKVATSEQFVRIQDTSGVLEAVGFGVDMKQNEFQLFSSVQGVYVTP
jgi:LPS export ABC transporter protein LptC